MYNSSQLPIRCERLKDLRREKNLTQVEIARKINVTEKTYRSWEKGEYRELCGTIFPKPDLDSLISLSDLFNCSIDYLLGRSDCRSIENHYISEQTGLTDTAINSLKSAKTLKGKKILAAINIIICNVWKKPKEESKLSFIELFANYLFFSGNDSEYYVDTSGYITNAKPYTAANGKNYHPTNKLRFYSRQMEQMYIMEMEDELKSIKKSISKAPGTE